MRTKSLKIAVRSILITGFLFFALTALTGCGIGHGSYRHGHNGRNYYNSADYYRNDYGYSGKHSTDPKYNPDNRGYGPMMGYDPGRSGYCPW